MQLQLWYIERCSELTLPRPRQPTLLFAPAPDLAWTISMGLRYRERASKQTLRITQTHFIHLKQSTTMPSNQRPQSNASGKPQPESHPVPTADADELADDVEQHSDEQCTITVTQSPGFLCHISAKAQIPIPPKVLWEQCLVHPDNALIFRHMERCSYRRIVSYGPPRRVRVAHEATWRFLMFSGNFTTHLDVEEDCNARLENGKRGRVMRFELLPQGSSIVSKFHGAWTVEDHDSDPNRSVSTLDQDIAFGLWIPPPLDGILKRISARQVRRIFQDLHVEAGRIAAGSPTLVPYDQVKDKVMGDPPPDEPANQ